MRSLFLSILGLISLLYAQNPVHNNKGYVDNMLYVKFADDSNVEIVNRNINLTFTTSMSLNHSIQNMGYWTKVHHIPSEELTKLRRTAEKNLDKKLPDPNSEFHFHLYDPMNIEKAKGFLSHVGLIEKISKVPIP